jgi:hypothetical protein
VRVGAIIRDDDAADRAVAELEAVGRSQEPHRFSQAGAAVVR